MGKVIDNDFTKGSSGLTGNTFVFRMRNGQTYITKRPKKRHKPFTEEELEQQSRFGDAIIYARAAIVDPEIKAIYASKAKGQQSAYNVATANFFDIPKVKLIDASLYDGSIGSKVQVKAIDRCKVAKVTVVIKDSSGAILEQGEAVAQANGLDWFYTATTLNGSPKGCTITATVFNLPGNSGNANLRIE